MFLNELNKTESIAFMQLVKGLIMADNVVAKEEKESYASYLEELSLEEKEILNQNLDTTFENLKDSTERNKMIICFELVGLALVDGDYDEREVAFLDKVARSLGVSNTKKISFIRYFENFFQVYKITVVDAESKIQLLKEQAEKLIL